MTARTGPKPHAEAHREVHRRKVQNMHLTYFYRDMTDAQNNATIHTGKDLKSKSRWDHC
jgi:hypothetical protein